MPAMSSKGLAPGMIGRASDKSFFMLSRGDMRLKDKDVERREKRVSMASDGNG